MREMLAALVPALYADDIFISYSRADASVYAFGLAEALGRCGFACFIDQWGTDPGRELPRSLVARLTSCTVCVLVATPAACSSAAVRQEIETYRTTTRPIIPIRFGDTSSDSPLEAAIAGLAVSHESREALDTGTPSARVIARIEKSFTYTRRNERMRRVLIGASAVLFALLGAIGWASWTARTQIQRAAEQTAIANRATRDADEQKALAADARRDATTQARVAAEARAEAEVQQDRAAASARAAAAQQRLASFRRALADAELERTQGDDRIVDPARKALEAYRQYPSGEADALLRYSLDRLPHLKATLVHPAAVTESVISRDGRFVSTIDVEATVRVWDVAGPSVLAEYRFDKRLTGVRLSRDGGHVAVIPSRTATDRRSLSVVALVGSREIVTLPHDAAVVDACFSGNGDYLASVSSDGLVRVWRLARHRPASSGATAAVAPVSEIRADRTSFDEIVLSDDGQLLALIEDTAEENDDVPDERSTIFRVATAAKVLETPGRPAFSSRGRFFAYVHRDEVWLKTLQNPARTVTRNVEPGTVNAVAFDPEDRLFATAGDSGSVKIYDVANDAQEILRLDHRSRVTDVHFGRAGELVTMLTVTGDGTAHLWLPSLRRTVEDRQTRYVEAMRIYALSQVSGSTDGRYYATSGESHAATVWEKTFHGGVSGFFPDGPLRGGTFSRDGRYVTVTTGRSEYQWDTVGQQVETRPVLRETSPPSALARVYGRREDRRYAAGVASADARQLHVVDTRTGAQVAAIPIDGALDRVAFSPDGRCFVVLGTGTIAIHETVGGRPIVQSMAADLALFSPDSALVAARIDKRTVTIHDLPGGRIVARRRFDGDVGLWWAPDGHMLAIREKRLWLWKRSSPLFRRVERQIGGIGKMAASPQGTSVAIADADGTARVLTVADGALTGPLRHGTLVRHPQPIPQRTAEDGSVVVVARRVSGEPATVSHMAFTSDDRYLATVAAIGHERQVEGGTVTVWDVRRRSIVSRIEHEYPVHGIAFTRDSRHLVVIGEHRVDQLLWRPDDLAAAVAVRLAELGGFRIPASSR